MITHILIVLFIKLKLNCPMNRDRVEIHFKMKEKHYLQIFNSFLMRILIIMSFFLILILFISSLRNIFKNRKIVFLVIINWTVLSSYYGDGYQAHLHISWYTLLKKWTRKVTLNDPRSNYQIIIILRTNLIILK